MHDIVKHISLDARRYSAVALKTLVEICAASSSDLARIAAAKEIIARGWDNAPPEMDDAALERAATRILEAKRMKALPPHQESEFKLVVNTDEKVVVK
jgi:hypothetical protein